MELTDFLNPTQEEAVRYLDGPEIIIAGAGSGKTRVLTYKIAYLLEMGYKPYEIMALTFTNKAAKEMKERIAKLVDPTLTKYLWMGTFHSIFSRILRVEYQTIGFNSNYTIYDTADSKSLIKSIVKDFGLEKDKEYKEVIDKMIEENSKLKQNFDSYDKDKDKFIQDYIANVEESNKNDIKK